LAFVLERRLICSEDSWTLLRLSFKIEDDDEEDADVLDCEEFALSLVLSLKFSLAPSLALSLSQ
jgi:hypothetical protein